MEIRTIGIDLGKTVFHLVGVNARRVFRYSSARRSFKVGGPSGRRRRHAPSDQDVADSAG